MFGEDMQSDQLHVLGDLFHFILRDGPWLTREPPCRFQQLGLFHVRLSQSVLLQFVTFIQNEHEVFRQTPCPIFSGD